MAKTNYHKYKILIDPQSKKVQGLKAGDVVRRQYYDAPNLIYSLLIVLETGVEMVGGVDSAYFIGALVEGDEPKAGQPLDFVRVTNLFDRERGGALYLTASDSDAPYMDVIDGMGMEHSLLSTEGILRSEGAFRFSLDKAVSHPEKLIISYKIRASKPLYNVPLTLGYDYETDGADSIGISTEWEYKLTVITIDFPSQYTRELCIAPSLDSGDWCEIKDLNVVRLSDISNFSKATKARMGRISGVIDPVFGALDGYGAYFQNLYATRNVNIAGTLTAGDENGFASTFYVGKIHKNVIPNSLCPVFIGVQPLASSEKSPAGVGGVWETGQSIAIEVQTSEWRKSHTGRTYCFSIWVRSQEAAMLTLKQDGYHIGDVQIDGDNTWKRVHVSFTIRDTVSDSMIIGIDMTAGMHISSPQMESGETPSLYQPTDGTLSMVEDYGAWFSKGGIGGTIQNPLLRLNEDGSISSRDGSFVINPDGTGHFASGRFRWTKDTITLQDITIKWENFDEETKRDLTPKSVTLTGTEVFHYPDILGQGRCEPDHIMIFATENGFTANSRRWHYLNMLSQWCEIANGARDFLAVQPDGHYWENRNVLTIRYIATYKEQEYEDSFTVFKQCDGSDAYSIYIDSSNGLVFRNNVVSSTLTAHVMKGGEEVTALIPAANFRWVRVSDDPSEDELWNNKPQIGKSVEITGEDVSRKAVFNCEVILSTT